MATAATTKRITVTSNPKAPLSKDLRDELSTLLLNQGKVKELQTTLTTSTISAGWQSKVQERVMQILRNGEVRSIRELEKRLVSEALGRELLDIEEDEEELDDNKQARHKHKGPKIDIKIPDTTVKAGTKVVRAALEGSVDVKEMPSEDREWKDWR